MKKILPFLWVLSGLSWASAQTFNSATGAIQDVATNDFAISVTGLPSVLDTNNFGLEQVCIDLTHTWDSDLDIRLIAPDGTEVMLSVNNGGDGDNYTNTCFLQTATQRIAQGTPPFTGTFRPQGQLGRVNNGQSGNGTWTLRITDVAGGDVGTLLSGSITFGNQPATYQAFTSTNLPLVIINTNGQNIGNDPKVMADMGIVWNGAGNRNHLTDPFNHYNGKIGIELRGSSSSGMPKKPYGFELWDVNGNAIDAPILGMPAESDWALIAAYSDKTMMRNALTYHLAQQMGHYAPRGRFVEVVINGEYAGLYWLCEKIKRDPNRVNIANLQITDISGDELTGGYIIKVDKASGSSANQWTSLYPPANNPGGQPVPIILHYPNDANTQPQQLAYIHGYVDSFERALAANNFQDPAQGFRRFADEASFIDYFLLTEFNRNLDAYRSSCYFYKDKDSRGGKLKMGPAWDYDLSFGNADFCDSWKTTGWAYDFNTLCPNDYWQVPFWWPRFMQDTAFVQNTRCRWENLKNSVFAPAHINQWLDSVATTLDEAQTRNFAYWGTMGVYVWPNYYVAADYAGEVDTMQWWIGQRWQWLDDNIQGLANQCDTTVVSVQPVAAADAWEIFPNPAQHRIFLRGQGTLERLELIDALGRIVYTQTLENQSPSGLYEIPVPASASAGLYWLRWRASGAVYTQSIQIGY